MQYWKWSLRASLLLYILTSFIKWDLLWVLELGEYSVMDRVGILLLVAISQVLAFITYTIKYKG